MGNLSERDSTGIVSQSDRDAAANYWRKSKIGTAATYRGYVEGAYDESDIVQAFARHRTAHIEAQAAELANMRAVLVSARSVLTNSGAESGYCMCGSSIASHDIYSGHSPVDSHAYHAEKIVAEIEAALGAKP